MRLAIIMMLWLAGAGGAAAQTTMPWDDWGTAEELALRLFEPARVIEEAGYMFVVARFATKDEAAGEFEPFAVAMARDFPDNERVTSDPGLGDRSVAFSGPGRIGHVAYVIVWNENLLMLSVAAARTVDPLPDLLAMTTPWVDEAYPSGVDLLDRLPRLSDMPAGFTMTREGVRNLAAERAASPVATPAATPVP